MPDALTPTQAVNALVKTPALPDYPAADFDKNLPEWQRKMIDTGKKTPGELLAMLSTKATFSEPQKARILSMKPAAPAAQKPDALPSFIAAINNATSGETAALVLDQARDELGDADYDALVTAYEAKFGN
jgi:hypothetical protein